jgi:hypothetical protein
MNDDDDTLAEAVRAALDKLLELAQTLEELPLEDVEPAGWVGIPFPDWR